LLSGSSVSLSAVPSDAIPVCAMVQLSQAKQVMLASLMVAAGAFLQGCNDGQGDLRVHAQGHGQGGVTFDCGNDCEVTFACTGKEDVGTFTPKNCITEGATQGSAGDKFCAMHANGTDAKALKQRACKIGKKPAKSLLGPWAKAFDCGADCEVTFACTGKEDVGTFTPKGCRTEGATQGSAGDKLCEAHNNRKGADALKQRACRIGTKQAFDCGNDCEVTFACTGKEDVGTFTPKNCITEGATQGSADDKLCEAHWNRKGADALKQRACRIGKKPAKSKLRSQSPLAPR